MKTTHTAIDVGDSALVFGGTYGNLQATEAILAYARSHGFGPENTIFTGDLVAYCGEPQATVDLVRGFGCHAVMGNCEESLSEDRSDCGCGFDEGTECNLLSAQWFSFCQRALDAETKRWMGTLPRSLNVKIGNYNFLCTHGTNEAINQFVFPSDIASGKYSIPKNQGLDGYIVGHSGIPFVHEQTGMYWINSGAAGMPANDGTARIWFATLKAKDGFLDVELIGLGYDLESAGKAMIKAGLENGYHTSLSSGIWPSHDVLPEPERLQTGIPIEPRKKALKKAPFSSRYRVLI